MTLIMETVSGCGQITYDDDFMPQKNIVTTSSLVAEDVAYEYPHSNPRIFPQQVIRICYQWTDEADILLCGHPPLWIQR